MSDERTLWPWAIVGGLGFVVTANLSMVAIAMQHPSAPAAEDHYAQAAMHDQVLARRRAAAELGWTVTLRSCVQRDRVGCVLGLTVRDREGQPVTGLAGTVEARRADDARLDRTARLTPAGDDGGYRAALELLRPGHYRLVLRLEGGPSPWVGHHRTFLTP